MDAQSFKDTYMNKTRGSFKGPEIAALVGVPQPDGSGRTEVQMDVPGLAVDEAVGAVGIYGDQKYTDPKALEYINKNGHAPYMGTMRPSRSDTGKQFGIPAHPSFNREATEQYMPDLMKGIGPGMMPAIRY